jgi:hypothetical protein
MKSPSGIAKKTMDVATPIAIFAPVERFGCGVDVSDVIVELVLDAVLALLGADAGGTLLLATAESDKVGVKRFKIALSVLCHRT